MPGQIQLPSKSRPFNSYRELLGRRATYQIDRFEEGITQHFFDVTCKTNKVTDVRKNRTFQLMNLDPSKRPSITDYGPSSAVHYIPGTEIDPEEREAVYTDQFGRPDIERIHRERADKFYHHKINKLMSMMNERTSKRRTKSAPSTRADPTPHYTVNNLPETIPENRPMTRGDAEYQLKKMRVTLQKQPSMLYGEVKSETTGKKGAGTRVSSGNKREISRGSLIRDMSRSSLNQGGRKSSASNSGQERRTSGTNRVSVSSQERRSITRDKTSGSGASQGFITGQDRVGSAQNRRAASAALPRRSSFKPPADVSDSDSNSDSDSSAFLPARRRPPQGLPPALSSDQAYYNAQGLKLREFQEKKFPSRFLDPNPDFRSRQKPFPILFDPGLLKAYNTFCRRAARVKTISQSQQDLANIIAQSEVKDVPLEIWESGYVHKQAWAKDSSSSRVNANSSRENSKMWDTGPKF
ncbi:hypothetical protein ACHWQZ_G012799 [Mnemiopsis leidyi]